MATPIEIIRANLMGLPDEITDIIIQVIIDSSRSLHDAAIALCDSAASIAAASDSEDIKIGSLAIKSTGKTAADWMAIKDNLLKRAITGEGVIIDPNGGSSTADSAYGANITGQEIDNQFWTDQFGYYPTRNPEYE